MSDIGGLVFEQAPPVPETFNVLAYGRPKSGKSTAAATAPGPIMWLNTQGRGALGYARKTAAQRGTVIHEVILDPAAVKAGTLRVTDVLDEAYRHVREGREPQIQTVVVDTIGDVRDMLSTQLVVPGAKNSIQQWGQVAEKVIGFVRAMRDLPVNLVLLAHVDQSDDDEAGRVVRPLIGGKATEVVTGEVDVLAYCSPLRLADGEPVRYFGQLVEGRGRVAGDRSGGLADERGIRELDLSDWLEAYRAALTPDTSDLPWDDEAVVEEIKAELDAVEEENPDAPGGQFDMDDARAEAA